MKTAGKCPPEKEELEKVAECFYHTELYLEKHHLDEFGETLEQARKADVDIASIHTPHVSLDELHYFREADRLADELDAYLVVHSQFIHHTHIGKVEERIDFRASYGYENNPGVSVHHLENVILGRGKELALDTAHLYLAEPDYLEQMELLLEEADVQLIHLADASDTEDGLPFGDGEMDMEEVCRVIDRSSFDGIVVLEVMPGRQEEAREKWEEYTGR
ncbi:MAG: sugar phosphate isomerase/epimerase family protein [Candidatus Nanohaloarchaea archaeon]